MERIVIGDGRFHKGDCIVGMKRYVKGGSVDLVVTDPPYGIEGDKLHRHYNRNEDFVVDGYIEVPVGEYGDFSRRWIKEMERTLRPGGQAYIVSGYTNLYHILDALRGTSLREVNHIIWKYNFGVFTLNKYISSHYHILFYEKPGDGRRRFDLTSRFGVQERDEGGGSLNYKDREDVWVINREYKPGKVKNKNELPTALLMKMLQYSSHEGDLVMDPFMGGFSTAKVAIGMGRRFIGFEMSSAIFDRKLKEMNDVRPGCLLEDRRVPDTFRPSNARERWTEKERRGLVRRYERLRKEGKNKKEAMAVLMKWHKRGRFAILNALKKEGL